MVIFKDMFERIVMFAKQLKKNNKEKKHTQFWIVLINNNFFLPSLFCVVWKDSATESKKH